MCRRRRYCGSHLRSRRIVYVRRGHCGHGRRWKERPVCSGLFCRKRRRYRHRSSLRSGSGGYRGGVRHDGALVRWSTGRRCGRSAAGGGLREGGAAAIVIQGDHARVHVADFAVLRLDARKNKAVEQDRETLAARNCGDRVRSLPRLGENRGVLGMSRAVDEAKVVRPSGRSHEKRTCE